MYRFILPNGLDSTLLIAIVAGFSYFFGRLIVDNRPQREIRQSTMMEGFVFLTMLVIFPICIVFLLSDLWGFIQNNQLISLITYVFLVLVGIGYIVLVLMALGVKSLVSEFIKLFIGSVFTILLLWGLIFSRAPLIFIAPCVLSVLLSVLFAHRREFLMNPQKTPKEKKKETNVLRPILSILNVPKELTIDFPKNIAMFYLGDNSLLFVYSLILAGIILNGTMSLFTFCPESISLLILVLYDYALIAILYGFNGVGVSYPKMKFYLTNKSVIEGLALKFEDYVFVNKNGKKIYINKDSIRSIEEKQKTK